MKKYLSLVISLILTAFIISMSAKTGTESASLSGTVTTFVKNLIEGILPSVEIDFDTLHLILRKGAHMSEYFLLGISYAVTLHVWGSSWKTLIFLGLFIACLDELSQFLSEDRGPSVWDVLIFDYPGYLLGALSTWWLLKKRKRKI
jgi:VanZ family protein